MPILFGVPFVLISCGFFDDNSQPEVESITNQTLYVGGKTIVEVNVTDAEVDDTHTISASSDDTSIATVSVKDTTLTITGIAVGMTTITVSATDDSGQDNAASTPVTFEVTVNPPSPQITIGLGVNQPPSFFIDKGICTVGMTLKPGEGCSYDSNEFFAEINFFVRDDGTACREQVPKVIDGIEIPEHLRPRNLKFCVEWDIDQDDFFQTSFAASKNPDGSWTVRNVP